MRIGKYKPSQIRKAIVIAAGMTIEFGNQLVSTVADTSPQARASVTLVVGVATTVLAFLVKNAPLIDSADDA